MFPWGRFYSGLMLESCTGDCYPACVQKNNKRAKETRQSLCFKHHSLPIQIHLEQFDLFPWELLQFGPNLTVDPHVTCKQF